MFRSSFSPTRGSTTDGPSGSPSSSSWFGLKSEPVTRAVLKDELVSFATGEVLRREVRRAIKEALADSRGNGVDAHHGHHDGHAVHHHPATTTPFGLMRRHFSRDFVMQVPVTVERERLGQERRERNENYGSARLEAVSAGRRASRTSLRSMFSEAALPGVSETDELEAPAVAALATPSSLPLLGQPREPTPTRRPRASLLPFAEDEPAVPTLATQQHSPERAVANFFPVRLARRLHRLVELMVKHQMFEHLCGLLVVVNAIFIGYESDKLAVARVHGARQVEDAKQLTDSIDSVFCIIFVTEVLLRMYAYRSAFWIGEGFLWNWFDLCMVGIQVVEQVVRIVAAFRLTINLSMLRLLRLFRVIRIFRLLRVLHLFDELRVIVSSITSSTSSLLWAMVLLLLTVFVFSELFLQIVLSAGDTEHAAKLEYYFGSLYRTILTMFECIVGGLSWDDVVWPLVTDVSPLMGVAFCVYISMCMFAMMNLLTGIFVDKAMRVVREDKDTVLAWRIRDLFMGESADMVHSGEEITFELFEDALKAPAMVEYFRQINVEVKEARWLFDLIDMDGSGSLDSKEIVDGCLSLRGPARALELAILMKDVATVQRTLQDLDLSVREQLAELSRQLGGPAASDGGHQSAVDRVVSSRAAARRSSLSARRQQSAAGDQDWVANFDPVGRSC